MELFRVEMLVRSRMFSLILLSAVGWGLQAASEAHAPEDSSPPVPQAKPEGSTPPWSIRPNLGYGLFDVVSLSPFASLRCGSAPLMPSSLSQGTGEVLVVQSWAKDFTATPTALIDFEVLRTDAKVSWAMTDSLSLSFAGDASERAPGGALGRMIVEFHRLFGVRGNDYGPYPSDYYRFSATSRAQGLSVDVPSRDPQPFESSGVLSVEESLTHGDGGVPEVACGLGLRRVLARGDLTGGSPLAVSGSLCAGKALGDFVFYLGTNVSWFGDEEFFGLRLRSWGWSGLSGVEWRCASNVSMVLGYLVSRGAVPRLPDFSLPTNEVSGGIKWEPVPGIVFSLGILENIINPYNTPDFGFQAELAVRW